MIVEDREKYKGLVRRYSDKGVYIMGPDGAMYSEAVDLAERTIEYTETDVLIDH